MAENQPTSEAEESKLTSEAEDIDLTSEKEDSKLTSEEVENKLTEEAGDSKPMSEVEESKLTQVEDSKPALGAEDNKITSGADEISGETKRKPTLEAEESKLSSEAEENKLTSEAEESKISSEAYGSKQTAETGSKSTLETEVSKLMSEAKVSHPTLEAQENEPESDVEDIEPTPEAEQPREPWKIWNKWVHKWRHYIIFFWLCIVFPIGIVCKPKFIEATDSTFKSIPGTDSADAEDIYEDAYLAGEHENDPLIILLQQTKNLENETMIDGTSALYNATKSFVASYTSYLVSIADDPEDVVVGDYYSLDEAGLHDLAIGSYYSTTYQVMMMTVTTYIPEEDVPDYADDAKDYGEDHVPKQLSICYTGSQYFQQDMSEDAKKDMAAMDTFSLPFALFILCLVLKGNLALMLIVVIMIFTSMMAWGTIMYPIALAMQVIQFTPSIMMSLTIALGIDYSLFILSRTTNAIPSSSDSSQVEVTNSAVSYGMESAGHSILVSGSTILLCLVGLALLPLQIIVSMGIGSGIAVGCVLLVNLTLVPSFLYTKFGRILLHLDWQRVKGMFKNKCCKKEETGVLDDPTEQQLTEPLLSEEPTSDSAVKEAEIETETVFAESSASEAAIREVEIQPEPLLSEELTGEAAIKEAEIVRHSKGWWFTLGKYLVRLPSSAIILSILLLVLIVPVAVFCPELETSISIELFLPSDASSMECYDTLSDVFGAGAVAPYKIIFDGRKNHHRVDTSEGFDVMHRVVSQLNGTSSFSTYRRSALSIDTLESSSAKASFSGISTLNGELITYSTYEMAMECGTNCSDESLRTIAYLDQSKTTENRETTYISATLDQSPYSVPGTDWLTDARDTLDALKSNGDLMDYNVVLEGSAAVEYDAMKETYKAFPLMIAITTVIVLLLMGCFFLAAVTPIRSIFSIACTQVFCFGALVLVYQRGIFDWIGITSLSSWSSDSTGEVSFISPIMGFSIIVGLSLDYDVFLITRVLEYRLDGFNDKSSVLLGLQGTGGIITAAGIIMSVAFGGLFASSSLVLNQFAFLMVSAVLLDTFVVRTVIVPILFGYTDKYSWWPRKLPPIEKCLLADNTVEYNAENDLLLEEENRECKNPRTQIHLSRT